MRAHGVHTGRSRPLAGLSAKSPPSDVNSVGGRATRLHGSRRAPPIWTVGNGSNTDGGGAPRRLWTRVGKIAGAAPAVTANAEAMKTAIAPRTPRDRADQ